MYFRNFVFLVGATKPLEEVENMSLLGKYSCGNTTVPICLSFSTAVCSTLISIVATVGNSFVVLAVFLNPNKDLQSPFNYFVVNLSIADLAVGLITAPLSAVYHFFQGLDIIDQSLRGTMRVSFFISCTASIVSLSALALDRYVAITYPLFYRSNPNTKRSLLVAIGVWMVSILLSMIYFAVGYNKFLFIVANTALVVTFVVLLFTSVKIFKFLRAQVKQWDNLHDSSEENLTKKQAIKREKKITKTLVIMLLFFLASYLPSCICIYIINFCSNCDCVSIMWLKDIQFVVMMTNSGVNPFVYAWRLENFRKAFKSILTCQAFLKLRYLTQVSTLTTDGSLNTNTGGTIKSEVV